MNLVTNHRTISKLFYYEALWSLYYEAFGPLYTSRFKISSAPSFLNGSPPIQSLELSGGNTAAQAIIFFKTNGRPAPPPTLSSPRTRRRPAAHPRHLPPTSTHIPSPRHTRTAAEFTPAGDLGNHYTHGGAFLYCWRVRVIRCCLRAEIGALIQGRPVTIFLYACSSARYPTLSL